jgi:hypothetical protein
LPVTRRKDYTLKQKNKNERNALFPRRTVYGCGT